MVVLLSKAASSSPTWANTATSGRGTRRGWAPCWSVPIQIPGQRVPAMDMAQAGLQRSGLVGLDQRCF
jgi:hypothetical protein